MQVPEQPGSRSLQEASRSLRVHFFEKTARRLPLPSPARAGNRKRGNPIRKGEDAIGILPFPYPSSCDRKHQAHARPGQEPNPVLALAFPPIIPRKDFLHLAILPTVLPKQLHPRSCRQYRPTPMAPFVKSTFAAAASTHLGYIANRPRPGIPEARKQSLSPLSERLKSGHEGLRRLSRQVFPVRPRSEIL